MKKQTNTIAQISLIISGIAALASVVTALVMKSFSLPVQISLALMVVALAVFIILDPQALKNLFTGSQAKHGSNSLILILAVLGIIVVINLLGYHNTLRWDLTEDKTNSLADETLDVLKTVNEKITAQAFFSINVSKETAETLLKNYSANANGKFAYEFIDPNEEPVLATNAGITRDGSIVLTQGQYSETITTASEQEITSAIIRLQSPQDKVIYVLSGHGESSFNDTQNQAYGYAHDELKSKNYTIKSLNLLASNAIPEDAKAIVLTGPQKPLSENEVALLKTYLDAGGSLLVMLQPTPITNSTDQADPLSDYLKTTWNITVNDDFVIDLTANPNSTAVVISYGSHSITSSINNMVTVFPTARTINIIGSSATGLAYTTDQAWAETDFDSLASGKISFDPTSDTQGPILVAAAVENVDTGSRLVIIGDSDFANNTYYGYYGNADLFLNTVNWLVGQEQLMNLSARTQTTRLLVPPSGYMLNAILLATVVFIPLAIIIAAIVVFVKRRREV